jgi:hypothetical protein
MVMDKNHRDYVLGELLTNKEVELNEPGTHPHQIVAFVIRG